MKISIVFPYNMWGGAFRSTYELSNRMISKGHIVKVYIPFIPFMECYRFLSVSGLLFFIRGILRSIIRWNRVPWFKLRAPVKIVPVIHSWFLDDADVIIANHWPTANAVYKLNSIKGRKFYFIRDVEQWMECFNKELDAFRLPMGRIVVAPWIKDFIKAELGLGVAGVVMNGTNIHDFSVENKIYKNPPSITMVYGTHPAKGMEDGFKVLSSIKRSYPDVNIILFGFERPKNIEFEHEFIHRPTGEALRNIYSKTDIFLSTSHQEGSGNPPREAMVAKCAVVTTNVGCIPFVVIPDQTAIVVEPQEVELMIEKISELIENPIRINELGTNASIHIEKFSWDESTTKLLKILEDNSE